MRALMLPFLPIAPTRTWSRAPRSWAAPIACSISDFNRSKSSICSRLDMKKGRRCRRPLSSRDRALARALALCRSRGRLGEGLLHPGDQGPKRIRLARRHVRQHLAVELDARLLHAIHELRIGQIEPELAHAGIDALDPQGAEAALLVATVAIGIA